MSWRTLQRRRWALGTLTVGSALVVAKLHENTSKEEVHSWYHLSRLYLQIQNPNIIWTSIFKENPDIATLVLAYGGLDYLFTSLSTNCNDNVIRHIARASIDDASEPSFWKLQYSIPGLKRIHAWKKDDNDALHDRSKRQIEERVSKLNLSSSAAIKAMHTMHTHKEILISVLDLVSSTYPRTYQIFALQILNEAATLQSCTTTDSSDNYAELFTQHSVVKQLTALSNTSDIQLQILIARFVHALITHSLPTLPVMMQTDAELVQSWIDQVSIWIQSSDATLACIGLQCAAQLSTCSELWPCLLPLLQAVLDVARNLEKNKHAIYLPTLERRTKQFILQLLRNVSCSTLDGELNPLDDHATTKLDRKSSRFWTALQTDDLDLPLLADMQESCFALGWVDLICEWALESSSTSSMVTNSMTALFNMARQSDKPESVLQAWLMHTLRNIRTMYPSPDILKAVYQVESLADLSPHTAPTADWKAGDSNTVLQVGCDALAVIAEKHYDDFMWKGGLQLVVALSHYAHENDLDLLESSCARIIANLSATSCSKPSCHVVDVQNALLAIPGGEAFLERMQATVEDPSRTSSMFSRSHSFRAIENMKSCEERGREVSIPNYSPDNDDPHHSPFYPEGINVLLASDNKEPSVDIVFVHGLRGHPFSTWRTSMDAASSRDDLWPKLFLANDLAAKLHVPRMLTLGYDADLLTWSSPWPALTLPERAKRMLDAMLQAQVAKARPVVFITHSLGGLLVKEMLVLAHANPSLYGEILGNTAGIVFLAVPHTGANIGKNTNADTFRNLISAHPATRDLSQNEPHLVALNTKFQEITKHFKTLSLGEGTTSRISLGISTMIVLPESANPGYGTFQMLDNKNHMDICKCRDVEDEAYVCILKFLQETL